MKALDSMDYVSRALAKKDTRPYCCSVYRDAEYLVATDGSRLHAVKNLTGEPVGFVDGLDSSFIDWRQVIPRNRPAFTYLMPAVASNEMIQRVKHLVKVLRSAQGTKNQHYTVRVDLQADGLRVAHETRDLEIEMDFGDYSTAPDVFTCSFCVNAKMFSEAIVPNEVNSIEFYEKAAPILLRSKVKGQESIAAVMPIRMQ